MNENFKPFERVYLRYKEGRIVAAYPERPTDMRGVFPYYSKEYAITEAPKVAGRKGGFMAARNMTKKERVERARKAGLAAQKARKKTQPD